MILFPHFRCQCSYESAFFPYISSFFPFNFYYQIFILEDKIFLKNIFTAYDITFKIAKYYQPRQYANYQPTTLAFSPSIKEQYIIAELRARSAPAEHHG